MNEEIVKSHILRVIGEINANRGNLKLGFSQQKIATKNMSITGGNGRLRIQPTSIGFDISLAGKSISKNLYPFMHQITGKTHDGYKQTNSNPFWKLSSLSIIDVVISEYAKSVT